MLKLSFVGCKAMLCLGSPMHIKKILKPSLFYFFPVLFAQIKESTYLYRKYFLLFTIKYKDYGK